MAINPAKLESALERGRRVTGVSVPPSVDLSIESYLVFRQRHLWYMALDAAVLQVPDRQVTDSMVDVQAAVDKVYLENANYPGLEAGVERRFLGGEQVHRELFVSSFFSTTGVEVGELLTRNQEIYHVSRSVETTMGLIKTLDDKMKQQLATEVFNRYAAGDDRGSIKKFINSRVNVPEYNARRIARDQTSKLFSNLSMIRQTEIGVTGYFWNTVGDGAVRPSHADLNGLRFDWNNPSFEGHPGDAIQCRCVADPDLNTVDTTSVNAGRSIPWIKYFAAIEVYNQIAA